MIFLPLYSIVGERRDLALEPGHEVAHHGLAEREVLVEVVEQLGEPVAERVLVLAGAERLGEREPEQQRVVRVADDGVVAIRDEVVGRDDVGDDTGRDFAHRPGQVLVIHRIERDLEVVGKGHQPTAHQLDELRLHCCSTHEDMRTPRSRGLQTSFEIEARGG